MATTASRRLAIGLLVIVTQAGCVGSFVPPPLPSTAPSSVQPSSSDGQACTAPESSDAPDPALVAGEWICTGQTTQMRFRFLPDGKYISREALEYNGPDGRFVFHRDQEGSYAAAGDQLELTPARSTRTRTMPEDPASDYADQPEPLKPRVFTFRADRSALHLHETGGHPLILLRVS